MRTVTLGAAELQATPMDWQTRAGGGAAVHFDTGLSWVDVEDDFIMEIGSCCVHILGDHREPGRPVNGTADPQPADGSGWSRRGLPVPGRGSAGQFTEAFDAALAEAGIEAVKIPPRSPRANAYAERFVLTARTEVTDRMLIFGQRHLRSILAHRSRQLHPPRPDHPVADLFQERTKRRSVLGGLVNEYERAA
jgi:putative transposase